MITNHVIHKGYQKIGFFGDLSYSLSFEDRYMGFRQSLINNHIVNEDEVIHYIQKYSFTEGIENYVLNNDLQGIVDILRTKELPEVLVCANDSNAFIVILALTQMGIRDVYKRQQD